MSAQAVPAPSMEEKKQPSAGQPVQAKRVVGPKRWIRRVLMTNRAGQSVVLLASGGVLQENAGVGQLVLKTILDGNYPIRVTLGKEALTPLEIGQEAKKAHRVLVVLAENLGKTPGTLVKSQSHEIAQAAGDVASKVVTMSVQMDGQQEALIFNPGIAATVADALVREMISN
jgi:hypothetical protein